MLSAVILMSRFPEVANPNQQAEALCQHNKYGAESHVESIINTRHKKSGEMQWTREGAH